MKLNTINTLVSGAPTLGQAAQDATKRYHEELEATIKGKNVLGISVSHSSGSLPAGGFFFSILATVHYTEMM